MLNLSVLIVVLLNVLLERMRDESPTAGSHELLWERVGKSGVFGVCYGHDDSRLCG